MAAAIRISSVEEGLELAGRDVGVSEWVRIGQDRLDRFADATGDRQWIHIDRERAAAELPGGKTIAHGYLTLSLIPALTADFIAFENLTRVINFGCNKVRFYAMVPEGSRVRARTRVLQTRKRGGALHVTSEVQIELEGARKPACVAETISMYFFEDTPGD